VRRDATGAGPIVDARRRRRAGDIQQALRLVSPSPTGSTGRARARSGHPSD